MKFPGRALLRPVRRWFDRQVTSPRFIAYQAGAMDRCLSGQDVTAIFDGHDHVLLRRHYYLPFPDERDLKSIRASDLVGLEVDQAACFEFHRSLVQAFDAEFREFPEQAGAEQGYHLVNGSFMAVDGNMYYGLIRRLAPRRIVEIGSGNSTKLACHAIRRNVAEGRAASRLTCIEPFHGEALKALPEVSEVIEAYVQEVDLSVFESLGEGDILFIDSTHTVRPGGDVWWEICEILPRLKSGVLVHVHDVSLPNPYPSGHLRNHWYWMEQYFLQAFLAFNHRFSVVWPGNLLMLAQPDRMKALFGKEYSAMVAAYPGAEPASFWMRVN
jgi:predicted O-methyltransferase YrrM